MKRPYVICHILSALDGKITGEFMGTPKVREVSDEYARIREAFHAQAWLYGTVTTKEFTQYRIPELDAVAKEVPEGDFIVERSTDFYYVSIDTEGEIGWESGIFRKNGRTDAHVIEILTEQTDAAIGSGTIPLESSGAAERRWDTPNLSGKIKSFREVYG